MAITKIAQFHADPAASSPTSSAAIDSTGATLIVVAVTALAGSSGTFGDSKSNSWTEITASDPSTIFLARVFYSVPTSVGSGHTFTYTGASVFSSFSGLVFAGSHASAPSDQTATSASDSAGTKQGGSVTPSEDNEVVVSFTGFDCGVGQSIDGGFTEGDDVGTTGNGYGSCAAYLIQTTATAANPTWTYNNTAHVSVTNHTFKAAGSTPVSIAPGLGSVPVTGQTLGMGFAINMPDTP
jgi:hypothetical protein